MAPPVKRPVVNKAISWLTREPYRSGSFYCDFERIHFPWSILTRGGRSSLLQRDAGEHTRTPCSSMLATAFASVHYPIRPVIQRDADGRLKLYKRNLRLFTPSDFDYSTYFDIIKYPYLGLEDVAVYRRLPWNEDGVICNDENDCYRPDELLPERELIHELDETTRHGRDDHGRAATDQGDDRAA